MAVCDKAIVDCRPMSKPSLRHKYNDCKYAIVGYVRRAKLAAKVKCVHSNASQMSLYKKSDKLKY